MILKRLFRFRSFISICRTHAFAFPLAITRSVSRSSALWISRKLISVRKWPQFRQAILGGQHGLRIYGDLSPKKYR
jgi:hypothetical protein